MEFDLNQTATREKLEEFADKIQDLQRRIGFKVSARGWCYQLETERLINKDEFDKVESWINKCRKIGILPIDFTAEEEGRKFSGVEIPHEENPIEHMRDWIEWAMNTHRMYRPDWWDEDNKILFACNVKVSNWMNPTGEWNQERTYSFKRIGEI